MPASKPFHGAPFALLGLALFFPLFTLYNLAPRHVPTANVFVPQAELRARVSGDERYYDADRLLSELDKEVAEDRDAEGVVGGSGASSRPMGELFRERYSGLPRRKQRNGALCYVPSDVVVKTWILERLREKAVDGEGLAEERWHDALVYELPGALKRSLLVLPMTAKSTWRTEDRSGNDTYDTYETTLVLQGSYDRVVEMIELTASVWRGPISLAVLVRFEDEAEELQHIHNRNEWVQRYVDLHLVRWLHDGGEPPLYPVNALRTIALWKADTDWVFNGDMDLVVTANEQYHSWRVRSLERELKEKPSTDRDCADLTAYVVPSVSLTARHSVERSMSLLQSFIWKDAERTMETATEMKDAVVLGMLVKHLVPMKPDFPPSYYPTRYERWLGAVEPYEAAYRVKYEPYYITRRGVVPFDDVFVGYGGSYNQQTMVMSAIGYQFVVAPFLHSIDLPWAATSHSPRMPGVHATFNALQSVVSDEFKRHLTDQPAAMALRRRWNRFMSENALKYSLDLYAPLYEDNGVYFEDSHVELEASIGEVLLAFDDDEEWSEAYGVSGAVSLITIVHPDGHPNSDVFCSSSLSAAHAGALPAVLESPGITEQSWREFILLRSHLDDREDHEIVAFYSGSVLVNRELGELVDEFTSFDVNMVLGVQSRCFHQHLHCQYQQVLADEAGFGVAERRWLNPKVIVGYAGAVRRALDIVFSVAREMERSGLSPSLRSMGSRAEYWWGRSLELVLANIKTALDYEHRIMWSQLGASGPDLDLDSKNGLHLVVHGKRPFFHHFSGVGANRNFMKVVEAVDMFHEYAPASVLEMTAEPPGLSLYELCCIGSTRGFCPGVLEDNRLPPLLDHTLDVEHNVTSWRCGEVPEPTRDTRTVVVFLAPPWQLDTFGAKKLMDAAFKQRVTDVFKTDEVIPHIAGVNALHEAGCALISSKFNRGGRYVYFGTPWLLFFREFYETFPGSRFVLSTMNRDDWFESVVARTNEEGESRWYEYIFGSECARPMRNDFCRATYLQWYDVYVDSVKKFFSARDSSRLYVVDRTQMVDETLDQFMEFVGVGDTPKKKWWPAQWKLEAA